ncbi:MAG: AIR carboxylase family protein [Candidatus Woesearchaeota archaeon]
MDYDFRICSAHKTPELLDEILKKEYDLIIAGAGLSAALPGVIASKVIAHVIGIPCNVDFNGLDALLSIMQMPPGIPVLCTPINGEKLIDLNLFLKVYVNVNIIGDKENKAVKKCTEIFDRFNISYEFSEELKSNKVNLYFFDLNNYKKLKFDTQYIVLNVPLLEKSSAKDSLKLVKKVNKGLWLGLNNGKNAAIAAMQLLLKKNELIQLRQEFHDEVIKVDKEMGI